MLETGLTTEKRIDAVPSIMVLRFWCQTQITNISSVTTQVYKIFFKSVMNVRDTAIK